jgi:hypothetical protein
VKPLVVYDFYVGHLLQKYQCFGIKALVVLAIALSKANQNSAFRPRLERLQLIGVSMIELNKRADQDEPFFGVAHDLFNTRIQIMTVFELGHLLSYHFDQNQM